MPHLRDEHISEMHSVFAHYPSYPLALRQHILNRELNCAVTWNPDEPEGCFYGLLAHHLQPDASEVEVQEYVGELTSDDIYTPLEEVLCHIDSSIDTERRQAVRAELLAHIDTWLANRGGAQ